RTPFPQTDTVDGTAHWVPTPNDTLRGVSSVAPVAAIRASRRSLLPIRRVAVGAVPAVADRPAAADHPVLRNRPAVADRPALTNRPAVATVGSADSVVAAVAAVAPGPGDPAGPVVASTGVVAAVDRPVVVADAVATRPADSVAGPAAVRPGTDVGVAVVVPACCRWPVGG